MTSLPEIFEHELKDLFSAESQLIAAYPSLQKAAATAELATAFEDHLLVSKEQKKRLQEIEKMLGTKLTGHTCKAMQGMIQEAKEIIEEFEESPARDAALIAAAQRVEHYEISAYGSARTLALALGHEEIAEILNTTLQEEGETDKLLTQISETAVIPASLQAGTEDEEDEEEGDEKAQGGKKGSGGKKAQGGQKTQSSKKSNGASQKSKGSQDLESMTRDELYKMAQEREIEGRSEMNKEELIRALG